jgi:hypothetical protein
MKRAVMHLFRNRFYFVSVSPRPMHADARGGAFMTDIFTRRDQLWTRASGVAAAAIAALCLTACTQPSSAAGNNAA